MSRYKRLTKQKWSKDIDLTQELGYSHIYKRLHELEDKIANGTLVFIDEPFYSKCNNSWAVVQRTGNNVITCYMTEDQAKNYKKNRGNDKMGEKIFRGKRKDNGKWVYGFYALFASNKGLKHGIYTGAENGCVIHYEVDPETVGQFTGLHDKNGNKIFEGDIVYNGVFKAQVELRNGCFSPFGGDTFYADECEVIGNIYDSH